MKRALLLLPIIFLLVSSHVVPPNFNGKWISQKLSLQNKAKSTSYYEFRFPNATINTKGNKILNIIEFNKIYRGRKVCRYKFVLEYKTQFKSLTGSKIKGIAVFNRAYKLRGGCDAVPRLRPKPPNFNFSILQLDQNHIKLQSGSLVRYMRKQ